jgi:2-succinyl-5-enolpyruvyl-6-hydroxy-3-cyclohexene-1-carboxylate synthase
VVVLTTSGTAVLNLSPAVAEAFQQRIPLLVLTADRPREILSQFNNQVCDQRAPYFNYSKGFFEFPAQLRTKEELEQGMQSLDELLLDALRSPAGPVHLNLPLVEPLYESLPTPVLQEKKQGAESEQSFSESHAQDFPDISGKKVLILAGMGRGDPAIKQALEQMVRSKLVVVVAENISNLASEHFISTPELVLSGASPEERTQLLPDRVIAFGQQVVSKRMKLFVQSLEEVELTELSEETEIAALFSQLSGPEEIDHPFQRLWKALETREQKRATSYLHQAPFGSVTAVTRILQALPPETIVHLGNSSTVRYAQLIASRPDLSYFANRGTSGIDGSVSAAVGAAMISDAQHLLVVGDLSFVYDSNALWNKDFPKNLKIVVLNDGGGGIFRLLDGPGNMDFFEEFSVTHHPVSLELLSGAFGRKFGRATNMDELVQLTDILLDAGAGRSVLEVDLTKSENSLIFKELFR